MQEERDLVEADLIKPETLVLGQTEIVIVPKTSESLTDAERLDEVRAELVEIMTEEAKSPEPEVAPIVVEPVRAEKTKSQLLPIATAVSTLTLSTVACTWGDLDNKLVWGIFTGVLAGGIVSGVINKKFGKVFVDGGSIAGIVVGAATFAANMIYGATFGQVGLMAGVAIWFAGMGLKLMYGGSHADKNDRDQK